MATIETMPKRLSNTWSTTEPSTLSVSFQHLICLGVFCGTVGAIYAKNFQREAEKYNAIFRKPWMRLPLYSFAFISAFYGGIQLPSRIFYKLTPSKNDGISHSVYSSSQDIVSKFRLFETFDADDSRSDVANYLQVYGTKALTKDEMIDNMALNALKEFDLGKMFRVKKSGKDRDPIFFTFGKIHGLENIAFADPNEVKET